MAFAARLNQTQNSSVTSPAVPNNDAIVTYQAEHIGLIERQFAAGEIDRAEYVRRYAEVSAIIRQMGK